MTSITQDLIDQAKAKDACGDALEWLDACAEVEPTYALLCACTKFQALSHRHEIAAVTGHRSLSQVEVYTRAANQERLARQAYGEQNVPGLHPTLEIGTIKKDKFK